jgi:cytochrome c oxidase subunit 2
MEPSAFQAWLAGADTQQDVVLSVADAGRHIFEQQGCASCHAVAGGGTTRGPSLDGLFGSTVMLEGGQKVVADENYLRESILQPQTKLVAGQQPIMPTYQGLLDEESVMQLIAYLKTLPAQSGHADGGAAGHEE